MLLSKLQNYIKNAASTISYEDHFKNISNMVKSNEDADVIFKKHVNGGDFLLYAAERGSSVNLLKALIEFGFDIQGVDKNELTIVMKIVRCGLDVRPQLEFLFHKASYIFNAFDCHGWHLIHHAAKYSHPCTFHWIIKRVHIDVNWKTQSGRTPLFLAGQRGKDEKYKQESISKCLLSLNADPLIYSNNGKMPINFFSIEIMKYYASMLLTKFGVEGTIIFIKVQKQKIAIRLKSEPHYVDFKNMKSYDYLENAIEELLDN